MLWIAGAIVVLATVLGIAGGFIVAKIDELRAELSRASGGLTQIGTDLSEALDRIAAAVAAGDPTDEDIAAARAIADGLVAHGQAVDAILAAPEEPPVEPPAGGGEEPPVEPV